MKMITKKDLEIQIEKLVKDDQHSQETIIRQAKEIEKLKDLLHKADNEVASYMYAYFNLTKRIEEVKKILKPYVEDKEANRYAPIYRAYDELGGFADE